MVRKPKKKKMVIVISKGTLDMAYPPLILATTAAAMDLDVHLYFTFWGMDLLNKKKIDKLKVASVGNPGLPIPNIIGGIPGMTAIATSMMKKRIEANGVKVETHPMPKVSQETAKALVVGEEINAAQQLKSINQKANLMLDELVGDEGTLDEMCKSVEAMLVYDGNPDKQRKYIFIILPIFNKKIH